MKTEIICFVIFTFLCCLGVETTAVSKCYSCQTSCNDPLDTENCTSVADAGVEYKCITMATATNGVIKETRGCIPMMNDTSIVQSCDSMNSQDGAACSICDEDLCNSPAIPAKSVSQCYFCATSCNEPLAVENCSLPALNDYRCVSMSAEGNGMSIETKRCILADDTTTIQNCNLVNSQAGGICNEDLCNFAGIYSISLRLLVGLFVLIKVL